MRRIEKTIEKLRKQLVESQALIDRLEKSEAKCRSTEAALRESERKLVFFIENAPAAIAMFDRDMRYIAFSRRWIIDYGLGDQNIIGKTHYEVFPEIPRRWKEIHRRALAGHAARCDEDPFPRLDGRTDWVRWEVLPWYESSGKIGGIIMFTEVITKRKELELELKNYRDHLEALVEERTTELEERNKKLAEEIAERMKAEEERRRIESRLFQAQRIEALDRFAGGIAHDLNNILYPIIINTEELLAQEPPGSPRFDILDHILKAANRQKDLVKKILSFSRRGEKNLRPIQVAPLLKETVSFMRSTLPSTIEIRHHIDTPAEMVLGDATQIQQVIMNLFQNAADAMPSQKGTIDVSLTRTHLEPISFPGEIRAGDYLELSVRDTGRGVPLEIQDHIFEPFYTTKDFGKGTGLGLSVTHGIVKSLGGAISVESEAGKGALFTVYLPIYAGEVGTSEFAAETGDQSGGNETILLVDDEECILASLKRALDMSGYRVVAIRDSAEALDLFASEPAGFDLVITDLTMPKMTGIELARKILEISPGIPVILSTGFNDLIDEGEAKSLGIRELLLKPTGTRELKNTVRKALQH